MSMICFKVYDKGKIINVVYNSSKSVKEFILDFTENNTNFTTFDPNIYAFISDDGMIINSPRFLNKKLCELIEENQTVHLVRIDIGGGGELSTVNISKNKTKEIQHTPNDIWYKYKNNGLNILSKCTNKNCISYNDDICINIGYVQNWDIFTNIDEKIKCPCCGNKVQPLNFAFKNCSYQIKYNIKVNGDYENRTNKGIIISDKYKIFDIKESGNADYYKLVFNIEKI